MAQNLPYIVYGTVTDSAGDNVTSTRVTLRNDTSGESINTNTNGSGQYVLDAANLASGYVNTDSLTVVCAFGLEEKSSSLLISEDTHVVDLTLVVREESADLTLCQVEDVLDELGDKTTTDISYFRIRKIILRSESEIEERAETKFAPTFVSFEVYDFDQYTSYKSADQQRAFRTDLLVGSRNDYSNTSFNDRIKLNNQPLINPSTQLNGVTTTTATSITVDSTTGFPSSGTVFIFDSTNGTEQITYTAKTSTSFTGLTRSANGTTPTAHADDSYVSTNAIWRNNGSKTGADDWLSLEPQFGGGGDYIVSPSIGILSFIDNFPPLGVRKVRTSYVYGSLTVPKVVERLCILLSVRDVLVSKGTGSQFDSVDNISLEGISISKGISSSISYFNYVTEEIERLWKIVGDMAQQYV